MGIIDFVDISALILFKKICIFECIFHDFQCNKSFKNNKVVKVSCVIT